MNGREPPSKMQGIIFTKVLFIYTVFCDVTFARSTHQKMTFNAALTQLAVNPPATRLQPCFNLASTLLQPCFNASFATSTRL
jgi:hypothetical protein